MSRQPNRLAAGDRHKLSGALIDRSKPLSFRLDGRTFEGFVGDTVLSAVLAAGVGILGSRGRESIVLSADCSPAVLPAALAGAPGVALPMSRMPATAGADLVTLGSMPGRLAAIGPLARLRSLLLGRGHSLKLRLDDAAALQVPLASTRPQTALAADVVVVGGGIAGMSAAAAAAAAGETVILIERSPVLGGDARFFGAVENEEKPEAAVARLTAKLAASDAVTVLLGTEALGLGGGALRARQVQIEPTHASARLLSITGKRVVLATGAFERLPLFPGNRSPGIGGTVESYHLADRYGVWLGRRSLFNTPHNYGYRLALLAHDAGVQVQRITDSRINPQSRFIDFCKASGITLASGLLPTQAKPAGGRLPGLAVSFAVAVEEAQQQQGAALLTEHFVAGGGFQPDVALWLMAGGRCEWDQRAGWLAAQGSLEGVVLAGAAAGYRSSSACLQSGTAAVAVLRGRVPPAIEDRQIDPLFETPDGPTPVAPSATARQLSTYLGHGSSFLARTGPGRRRRTTDPAELLVPLELEELAALVQSGMLSPADAGIVAAERCLGPGDIPATAWHPGGEPMLAAGKPGSVPGYLAGRFGARPVLVALRAADQRVFEPGCLVFSSSDERDPRRAVGVVVGAGPDTVRSGGVAVLARNGGGDAARLFVRDSSGAVPVEQVERLRPEPAPAAAD